MPLFEVAILEKPTEKEKEDGKSERLVLGPKPVVASDAQSAGIVAVMDTDEMPKIDKNRMEVLVRPFG